jgi:hypothetical protein
MLLDVLSNHRRAAKCIDDEPLPNPPIRVRHVAFFGNHMFDVIGEGLHRIKNELAIPVVRIEFLAFVKIAVAMRNACEKSQNVKAFRGEPFMGRTAEVVPRIVRSARLIWR